VSETRYRALVEASTLMVWSTDATGRADDMPGWRELTGQSLEEVRGSGWVDAIHPDDRPRVAETWARALETRCSLYEVEYRLRLADGSYRWYRARGAPVLGADGAVREWVGVFDDVDDARRAEEARTFLERASEALASTLTVDDALGAVARIAVSASGGAVDAFADAVAIDLPRVGGGFRRVAVESRDPAKSALANEIERMYPTPEDAPAGYAHVIRTGESELIDDMPNAVLPLIARDAVHLAMLRALDMYSALVVPLRSRDETLGAITLVLTGPARRRKYDARDLEAAEELARRAAIALDNAARYETERLSAERARRLLAVSAGLSEATTPEQVADVIFREAMAAVGADAGSLALVRGDAAGSREFEIVRTSGFAQPFVDRYRRFPLHAGRPLSDAMLAGTPRLIASLADWRREYPSTAEETVGMGFEGFAAVPIMSGGRALAAFTFSFREPWRSTSPRAPPRHARRAVRARAGARARVRGRARGARVQQRDPRFHPRRVRRAGRGLPLHLRQPAGGGALPLPAAAMLGQVAWDVFPGSFDRPFGRAFREAMATQQPASLEGYSISTGRWLEARVYPRGDGAHDLLPGRDRAPPGAGDHRLHRRGEPAALRVARLRGHAARRRVVRRAAARRLVRGGHRARPDRGDLAARARPAGGGALGPGEDGGGHDAHHALSHRLVGAHRDARGAARPHAVLRPRGHRCDARRGRARRRAPGAAPHARLLVDHRGAARGARPHAGRPHPLHRGVGDATTTRRTSRSRSTWRSGRRWRWTTRALFRDAERAQREAEAANRRRASSWAP
jgi:PAS domain S-box-containing protein